MLSQPWPLYSQPALNMNFLSDIILLLFYIQFARLEQCSGRAFLLFTEILQD